MAEKDRITNPSMGSNDLGEETTQRKGSGISPGTDTQTQIAAIGAQKKKEKEQEEEALLKAKANIDKAVNQKKLPEDTNNETL